MSESAERRDDAAFQEKRRNPRKKVIWSARVAAALGERQCTIFNVSRGGAQIKLDATLDAGSRVALTIPGVGRLEGWVVWSTYDRAGIEFADLTESQTAALEQALRGHRSDPPQPVSEL